jgi:PAS domain S-box-containing protein
MRHENRYWTTPPLLGAEDARPGQNPGQALGLKALGLIVLALILVSLAAKPGSRSAEKEDSVPSHPQNARPRPPKAVLLLFPYQMDLPASELAEESIRDVFDGATDFSISYYYEYLDLNRFPDAAYQGRLFDSLALKYGKRKIDLVMVAGERMLGLWLEKRSGILPTAPVIFYDIITGRLASRNLPLDVTGVSAVVDYSRSVQWLLRARPSVREMVIVHGVGKADQGYLQPLADLTESMAGKLRFVDLSDLPWEEIKRRVAALTPSSAVLYHMVFEDRAGLRFRPVDALRELASLSPVPVISAYDQYLGAGTVGGYMYSIEHQASAAARFGLRVLRGEAAGSIPMAMDANDRFMFDHLALRRYGIPLKALPPDSVVKNRQYSAWETHRLEIIFIGLGFIALLLLVSVLIVLARRLNAARLALSRLNAGLEAQVRERSSALSLANSELQSEIAERKLVEERRNRTARMYALLSRVNRAIIWTKAEEELYRAICDIAIDQGRFRMAWIGLLDAEGGSIRSQVHAGYEDGYLGEILVSSMEGPTGQDPTGRALRSGGLVTSNDIADPMEAHPWREAALRRGYRSSAALPIKREGGTIGVLSLYAAEPGFFTDEEEELLKEIGENISYAIDSMTSERRRKLVEEELRLSEERYHQLFEQAPFGIGISTLDGRILASNRKMEEITGYSAQEMKGIFLSDIYAERGDRARMLEALKGSGSIDDYPALFRRKDGSEYDASLTSGLVNASGATLIQTMMQDVSSRKQAEDKIKGLLAEKEIILKEVHHRLKNNMSVIKGLLSLQARALRDASAIAALEDAASRVDSMMVLYDQLYRSADYDYVAVDVYLPALAEEILKNFPKRRAVRVEKRIERISLDAKRMQSIGIIINELLTNIMKHAFEGRGEGLIAISAYKEKDSFVFIVEDDGRGMPESVNFESSSGFGLMLVGLLAKQLGGSVRVERGAGSRVILELPSEGS